MSVNFTKTELLSFLAGKGVQMNANEQNHLNSIFTACDTENESGETAPDGKLTGKEVPAFFQRAMSELGNLGQYLMNFMNQKAGKNPPPNQAQSPAAQDSAGTDNRFAEWKNMILQKGDLPPEAAEYVRNLPSTPEIKETSCWRNPEQKEEYIRTLEESGALLLEKADELGLSEQEKQLIRSVKTESITYGAARADVQNQEILFNLNDLAKPDKGNYIKIMMHEATHAVINEPDTKSQERACEARGIELARKLYNMGVIDDFVITMGENGAVRLSDINDDGKMNSFIDNWCNNSYQHLPEE